MHNPVGTLTVTTNHTTTPTKTTTAIGKITDERQHPRRQPG